MTKEFEEGRGRGRGAAKRCALKISALSTARGVAAIMVMRHQLTNFDLAVGPEQCERKNINLSDRKKRWRPVRDADLFGQRALIRLKFHSSSLAVIIPLPRSLRISLLYTLEQPKTCGSVRSKNSRCPPSWRFVAKSWCARNIPIRVGESEVFISLYRPI